ncbi:type II toxin-antitoxin system HicA family toxin [Carnimonas bestiolae]|uniref:type II toxin-antitoxin system HicA family toxin n=1 Tax=Carnimonas bestiolae TaxID=3402172 RepID=UPI003EDB90ED
MKYSEFRRWLKRKGVKFEPAEGSHFKIRYNDRQTIFPYHNSKEMPEPLRKAIIKQLGL